MLARALDYLFHPVKIIIALSSRGYLRFISDEQYIKIMYKQNIGYTLDIDNPQTFNEKIQWLKLHDRNPLHINMVDKYLAKQEVAAIIGEKYIVPTLGVWENIDSVDFDNLPDQFVLKCTHDSGGLVVVKNKHSINMAQVKNKLQKCLKRNFYYLSREWPYKHIKPRIIAEEYLDDGKNSVPEDYKIYCMNGKPRYIVIFHNRFNNNRELSESVYDINWNKQNFSFDKHFKIEESVSEKPECLEEMLELAEKLCKDLCQVRVDFYIVNNKIYFGEITYYTASGLMPMIPPEMDSVIGDMFDLYLDYDDQKK